MKVLAFGIVKDIFDNPVINIDFQRAGTVKDLKSILENKYPRLGKLGSYMIAVNNEYASPDERVHEGDEIAIIPPVSGG